MNLAHLPYTVFFEIVSHLTPVEALISRRISRDVCAALTRPELSISLILLHFPRSLEARILRTHLEHGRHEDLERADWAAVFATLARRYHHLAMARPWRIAKVRVAKSPYRLRGVTPWNRFLRLNDKTAAFDYWDPAWTFSPQDGLLVYPCAAVGDDSIVYKARDVSRGTETDVPFDTAHRVIRRVRLSHRILIFEWCEEEGYLGLNETETAHRHFATAFDVTPSLPDAVIPAARPQSLPLHDREEPWRITFRAEWKTHCLGLPLSHQDRFFSTHNATHYVVYIWQPTRSPWGEDAPLERLVVWEMGQPCAYRPSLDPTGANADAGPDAEGGPRVIRRLANNDLSTWGIRQSDTPRLRSLALDENTWDAATGSATGHVFFIEEQHRWCAGPHSSPDPPRQHHLLSTGIPLVGDGPRWVDDCGGPSTGAEYKMDFCSRGRRRDSWPGRAPCWRHDDFPYLTVSEVHDVRAGVRITARHCFMMETLSVHVRPQLCVEGVANRHDDEQDRRLPGADKKSAGKRRLQGPDGEEVQFEDHLWGELLGKGVIVGDERWLVGEDEAGDVTILMF
jgi:hypothetical protein